MARIIRSHSKTRLAPRKSPRQERAQSTVDAILRATAHILRNEGYEGLSTNAVAKKAGVSIGSLYQYFPSKEALVLALTEEHVQSVSMLLLRSLEEQQATDLRQVVESFISTMLKVHTMDPKLHQVISEQVLRLGGWKKVKELTQPGAQLVRAWLEMNAKQLRPLDPELATFILMVAVDAVTHAATFEAFDSDALARELSELVLRYLGAATPQSKSTARRSVVQTRA